MNIRVASNKVHSIVDFFSSSLRMGTLFSKHARVDKCESKGRAIIGESSFVYINIHTHIATNMLSMKTSDEVYTVSSRDVVHELCHTATHP